MTKAIAVSAFTAMALFLSGATIGEPKTEKRLVGSQLEALLLVGPASTAKGQNLEIMGQVAILESSDARNSVARMDRGSYIAVFGYISATGQISATRIEVLESQYVPGSSPVMVSGVLISSLDENGHVSLGELTIDVTPSLSAPTQIDANQIAVFTGVQPNQDGIMLAHGAQGFGSYANFSEYQNLKAGMFLASIGGGDSPLSIGGGDSPLSIGGGDSPLSIGGGDAPSSIGGGDSLLSIGGGDAPSSIGGGDSPSSIGGGDSPLSIGGGDSPLSIGGGD